MVKFIIGLGLAFSVSCSLAQSVKCDYESSVVADFALRDQLPEYIVPATSSWGPHPRLYPMPVIPDDCDQTLWKQKRIVAVAKKYIGLPYRHHHIPSYDDGNGVGLDCSNFTAWVYNYGLGIKISSNIHKQANTAGVQLPPGSKLNPGDLLFIIKKDGSRISHAVIYLDPEHIIDDHAGSVQIRPFAGWYKSHLAYARRIING